MAVLRVASLGSSPLHSMLKTSIKLAFERMMLHEFLGIENSLYITA